MLVLGIPISRKEFGMMKFQECSHHFMLKTKRMSMILQQPSRKESWVWYFPDFYGSFMSFVSHGYTGFFVKAVWIIGFSFG